MEFFFFIFFLWLETIKSEISIPFRAQNLPLTLNDEELIKALLFNAYFINITIGSSNQEIPVKIKSTTLISYIINSNATSYSGIKFDSEKSTTLQVLSKKNSYLDEEILSGTLVKDRFNFGNTIINELNFTLTANIRNESNIQGAGAIGLGKNINSIIKTHHPILFQLKNMNIINHHTFTLHFTKKNEGNLILGNYLHDLKKPIYLIDALSEINCYDKIETDYSYAISSTLYLGEKVLSSNYLIFASEIGLIIGSYEYYDEIDKHYFKEYLKNGKCTKKTFKLNEFYLLNYNQKTFDFFVCEKGIKIKTFPPLIFKIPELNFDIEFNYEDLWFEYGNKLYLMVVFPESTDIEDLLRILVGNIIFKKYDITFDSDRRIVGFYDKNKKSGSSKFFFVLLIIFILIGAFIYLISFIKQNKGRIIKKKTALELEDDGFFTSIK